MLVLLAALPFLFGLLQSPQGPDALQQEQVIGTLGAALDSQLTRFAAYGFSGTVLVVREGEVVLLKGYGLADVQRGIPNTAATRFELNSITKMFTGVAILQLVAQGRLHLNDPVEHYLPGFPAAKQGATIEQLATHTSGLILEGAALDGDSRDAFIRDVARTPREAAPGERYRYSNAGFSLLAAIIEVVSGETYEQYLRRHLFAPAAMRTALFRDEIPAGDARFAHGYVGTPARLEPGPPNPYAWGTRGAGGVWSTMGDVYRWLVALEARRVLPEAQWRTLIAAPRPPAEEAFGWHVDSTAAGQPRIHKGGGSDDFASQFSYYPRQRIAVIWASNNLRQRWRQTLNAVLSAIALGGEPPLSLPPVVPVARPLLEQRAGWFVSDRDSIELRAGPGYLYTSANRLDISTHVMFLPQDADHFTAFDPVNRAMTRLEFSGSDARSLVFMRADGQRVSARRSAGK